MNTTPVYPIIVGQYAGKPINCAPTIKPVYDKLVQAAQRGNHTALIAVKELAALSSGLLGKQNVYVRVGKATDILTPITVFLPGLKAIVYHWQSKGGYTLMDLQLDANYFVAVTTDGQTRMGLHRVTPDRLNTWNTKYVGDGKIGPQSGRLVVVADSVYDDASKVANVAVSRAMDAPDVDSGSVRRSGCDLHFTPGDKQLGGLVRYDALVIDDCRASALSLAYSMAQAHSQRVIWVADHGGSAVITQAMRILVDRGLTLENHTVHLYRPNTSPGDALKLAHQLKLTMNKSFAKTGWSLSGALSQWRVSRLRLNNKEDPYNKIHHTQTVINGVMATTGIAGAATIGATIPVLTSIIGVIGASGIVYSLGQSVAEKISHKLKR